MREVEEKDHNENTSTGSCSTETRPRGITVQLYSLVEVLFVRMKRVLTGEKGLMFEKKT